MLSDCAEIVAHFGYVGGWLYDFHSVRLNNSLLDGYLDAGQHLH